MFCSGSVSQFPAGVNTGYAQQGPYYGCFIGLPGGNLPNPAWFIIPISQSGHVIFQLSGTSDVDFVCWGPFSSPNGNCSNLTANTIVPNSGGNHGCGSSPSATETVSIVNAQAGEYYMLLVSNYWNVNQMVTFVQTNQNATGSGVVGNLAINGTDSLCVGQTATVQLNASASSSVQSISWTGPNGYIGSNYTQIFPNMTATTVYTVIGTAAGNQTCAATKRIKVLPNPTPAVVSSGTLCSGSTASFSASGGSSYSWSGPGAFSANTSSFSIPNAQVSGSGNYTVIASTNICTASAVGNLLVKPSPALTLADTGNYCAGKSFTLLANGASSYSWSGPNAFTSQGQNPAFSNNTTAMTGQYVVTGSSNSCSSSASIAVTIQALPNVVISAPANGTLCSGTTANFSASGGTFYSWNGPAGFSFNGANPSIANAQLNNSGTYSVLATLNSCTASATSNLQVKQSPTVTAGSIGDYCAGKSFSLGANGASTYSWSGPNSFVFQGQNPVFANNSAAMSGVYTVSGDNNGCASTATVNITINPLPNITILTSGTGTACVGVPISFTATGGTSYVWTGPGSFFSTSASPYIPSVQYSNGGTYTVLATLNTCTDVATRYLSVNTNPTVSVSQSGDLCAGKSFNLMSNGATTYTWSGPNGYNYMGQNPLFLNNAVAMSGLYTVTGEGNGCFGTASIAITVHALPNVTAVSSSGNACQNMSVTLTASGASAYSWAGPGNFASHQPTLTFYNSQPSLSGLYSLTGVDGNGCVSTATVYQTVQPNPYININSMDACIDKSILLNANGGVSYQWDGPANYSSTDQNPVINNAEPFNAGVYNVTVTSSYGCTSTASVSVNVYLNPIVNVSGNISVCKGKTFYFAAHGALNYKWLNSTGIVTQDPTFSISSTSSQLETTYTLVGTDGHFCSSFIPFYPIVNELPSAKIIPDVLSGCTPLCTNLKLEQQSSDVVSSAWSFSDQQALSGTYTSYPRCLNSPGVYTVSVSLTDAKTCTSVVTQTLEAYPTPKADFRYTPDQPTQNDNVVTFIDQSSAADVQAWSWDFYDAKGNKKDTSAKQNNTLTYDEVGNYLVYLKVTAANGCTDSIAKFLVIAEDPTFFIPGAFTPNGDGLNDVFVPKSRAVLFYEMQIYTRWGQLLYSTTDPAQGWDGKNSGEELPVDTYVYKFTVSNADKNPKVYKGQFALIK